MPVSPKDSLRRSVCIHIVSTVRCPPKGVLRTEENFFPRFHGDKLTAFGGTLFSHITYSRYYYKFLYYRVYPCEGPRLAGTQSRGASHFGIINRLFCY